MSNDLRTRYLDAMSSAASTVNIVTTAGKAGRVGLTVTAFSSVSADGEAPCVLVCVHELSPFVGKIIENGVFAVNMLQREQTKIADVFAGRNSADYPDKFNLGNWETLETGAPILSDGLAAFDCELRDYSKMDTHYVFYGCVVDVKANNSGTALVYENRNYVRSLS